MVQRFVLFLLVVFGAAVIAGPVTALSATTAPPSTALASPADATGDIPVLAISPGICFLLRAAAIGPVAGFSCLGLSSQANMDEQDINGDGVLTPGDFAGVDFDGNQVHQLDNCGGNPCSPPGFQGLWIIAFVPAQGAVTFTTTAGGFVDSAGNSLGTTWTCDSATVDPDCASGATGGDGVVAAKLLAHVGTDIAPIGPGTVTVSQPLATGSTIDFTVVGEPQTVEITRAKTTIQDGASAQGCAFPTGGVFANLDSVNDSPERSSVLAVARDSEGNAVTGAIIQWTTDDPTKAVLATTWTPTLDLGPLGIGSPNVVCGTAATGTSTVSSGITKDIPAGGATIAGFDPNATEATTSADFTVVGVPANMTLKADPASVPCDGAASSTVTATITDADGNPVAAGNPVTFSVVSMGVADPVTATTDDNGVAASTITPLSGVTTGVVVTVSAGSLVQQIAVTCAGATATPSPTATSTPTATDTATATATVTSTDTPVPTATASATDTATATSTDTPVPTDTATSTDTPVPTDTAMPSATATPNAGGACVSFGQKVRLVLGIFRSMSAREHGRRYRAAYDLNHDGRIDMDDLLIALEAPICRHGRR